MGKGIAIYFYLILLSGTFILSFFWLMSWTFDWKYMQRFFKFSLIGIWVVPAFLAALIYLTEPITSPMYVTEKKHYGKYVIDADKFNKNQAEWQKENYEITIDKDYFVRLWKLKPQKHIIDSVRYEFAEYQTSVRIRVFTDTTHHHIIAEAPTLYREPFYHFYYVFHSEKYGNMFFVKD